jgi:trimeric autotransporter adhesin
VGNLVNQHVRFIESGEFLTYPKPSGGNSLDRLIERKQMSTKTTFKRIALVAVASLGFGMLSVVPSGAAALAGFGSNGTATTATAGVQSISVSVKGKAVRLGKMSNVVAKFTGPAVLSYSDDTGTVATGGFAASAKINPNIALLTAPATSAAAIAPATSAAGSNDGTVIGLVSGADATSSSLGGDFGTQITTSAQVTAYYAGFQFTPDKAGTYAFLIWDDTNRDGLVSAAESNTTYTVVVTDAVSTISLSTSINNAAADADNTVGAVVKVSLADANGAATVPANESIILTTTGSASWGYSYVQGASTNVSGASTKTAYLTRADFDASGNAYIGLTNATAETVSVTASTVGSLVTPTTTATTVTFKTPTGWVASAAVTAAATTTAAGLAAGQYLVYGTTPSITLTTNAASVVAAVGIIDTTGLTWGNTNIRGTTTVTSGTLSTAAWGTAVGGAGLPGISYSLTWASTLVGNPATSYTVGTTGGLKATTQLTKTSLAAAFTATPSTQTVATGAKPVFKVTLTDDYENVRSGVLVTAAMTSTGRNGTIQLASQITDANGQATFTFTDASTSTTNLSDTITFTAGADALGNTKTVAATVTYVAGLVVTAVTVTTSESAKSVANLVAAPTDISAGKAGASAAPATITANVTTNNTTAAIAGVPVTFTVAGTGAAIPSTKVLAYTDSLGVATSAIYGWIAGSYTVTATAGGISGTGVHSFTQQSTSEARTVSATIAGSVVTASVKDRFGNGIAAATVYATATGGAYFGNGATSASAPTGLNGSVNFVVGGSGSVVVSTTNPADATQTPLGQTTAPKGYATNAATAAGLALTLFTATTVGDAVTAETGVGASFDAAGIASATVTVTPDTAVLDTAQAATDAAAEATDAANAATDAANAAAEAADAATAAAQDAADAVAALSTQVSEMVNALKKQITALTNLVIKIQKKVRA